ncbi:hypothetical protein [Roseimicrobium sp. ORNL1]|uniref:hypothetical protein n=1 Tax=Roseimicrobium sp. ORNL1 TaxID=2711231 RepID=UPI0013E1CF2D|nr:hypothetical protein [Roseimicrobium sp. ORNL1]QIF01015.1 hypothetical protein G5S37_05610 [Roseimicrobium sp. ORNL1]
MKELIAIVGIVTMLGVHPVKADCTFGGPGITPGTKKCTAFPAILEVETEGCYKFTYQGCEAKGNVGSGGTGTGNNNNNDDDDRHRWDDDDDDDNNGDGTGPIELEATCKDDKAQPKSCSSKVNYTKVDEFNTSPIKTCNSTPTTFKCGTKDTKPMKCKLKFDCKGKATKPNGCFNVCGSIQKDPTPPVGTLTFAVGSYALHEVGVGTTPPGVATVTRD